LESPFIFFAIIPLKFLCANLNALPCQLGEGARHSFSVCSGLARVSGQC